MQLVLWRHASANHYTGYDRALDPVGHKQAEQGGQWLTARYPETVIYTSGALRARQTAAYYPCPASSHNALNPGKSAETIYQFLQESGEENLIIVGHLPWIAQLAAKLRGEYGYLPYTHGMIQVYQSDHHGWQHQHTFQPQPISG